MFLACAYRVLPGFTGFSVVSRSDDSIVSRNQQWRHCVDQTVAEWLVCVFFSCPNSFRQKERREKKGKQKRKRSQQKGRQRKQESATNSPNRWREEHKTHQHGRPFSISIPRRQLRPDGEKRSPPPLGISAENDLEERKGKLFYDPVRFFLSFFLLFFPLIFSSRRLALERTGRQRTQENEGAFKSCFFFFDDDHHRNDTDDDHDEDDDRSCPDVRQERLIMHVHYMTAGHLVLLLLSSLFSLGNEITGDDDEKETDETKRRVHLVGGLSLRIERREAPEISGRNFQMDSLKKKLRS